MPFVLKLNYKTDVRRLLLQDEDVSYSSVKSKMALAWPHLLGCVAKYVDEEGDLCTLCEASFPDFLVVSAQGRCQKRSAAGDQVILRLELFEATNGTCESETGSLQHGGPFAEGKGGAEKVSATSIPGQSDSAPNSEQDFGDNWEWDWCPPGWDSFGFEGAPHDFWKKWQGSLLKPKKFLQLASKLRASGSLSGRVVGGLFAQTIPEAIRLVTNHQQHAGRFFRSRLAKFKPMLMDLVIALRNHEGMESSADQLEKLLSSSTSEHDPTGDVAAGETLLAVLTALDALPFEQKVQFFEGFYTSQEAKLHEILDHKWKTCWASDLLEHSTITCDGCGMFPIRGLRFKCNDCCDFDLCGECFAAKEAIHGGECSSHSFQCISRAEQMPGCAWFQYAHPWKTFWEGFGKGGKCKGKGKGHFKGKNGWKFYGQQQNSQQSHESADSAAGTCSTAAQPPEAAEAEASVGASASVAGKDEQWDTLGDERVSVQTQQSSGAVLPHDESTMTDGLALDEVVAKLQEMGFGDATELKALLIGCRGDMSEALALLSN